MTTATLPLPKTAMTVDEFWEFVHRPENEHRSFELHRGEVVEMSRPTRKHGLVSLRIGTMLMNYTEKAGFGYPVSNDSGVILEDDPGTVVGPDVAFFDDVRSFAEMPEKWGETLPVLAIEILSPSDRTSQVNAKIEAYLRSGVKVVWLVDPEEECVTIYRPGQIHQVVRASSDITGDPELPGFTCRVADLFRLAIERPPAGPTT